MLVNKTGLQSAAENLNVVSMPVKFMIIKIRTAKVTEKSILFQLVGIVWLVFD